MSLFDLADYLSKKGDTSYGYKTFRNTPGWDNDRILQILTLEGTPFGAPKMGWIRAFGKERQVVVFDSAHPVNYVYIDATPRKIIVSMAPKPGQVGGARDHIDPEDVGEKDYDTISATLSSMEPVEEIIRIVEGLLNSY